MSTFGSPVALRPVIEAIKSDLIDQVKQGVWKDIAFIGNSSDIYSWTPCFMVDMDVFLFGDSLDERLGSRLLELAEWWRVHLKGQSIDFEVRIIEGPYKPSIARLERPIIVLHLGAFTDSSYQAQSPVKRWAWRKYACLTEPGRLARLAPPPPDLSELLSGHKGVDYRLNAIASGSVTMTELVLPSFHEVVFSVAIDDVNFAECCFAYALTCARNHGRVLGFNEADSLSNETYFHWYSEHILKSDSLLELVRIKMQCRNVGFDVDRSTVQTLAEDYLRSLAGTLRKNALRALPVERTPATAGGPRLIPLSQVGQYVV